MSWFDRLKDRIERNSTPKVLVRRIPNGPFKGRLYIVRPNGRLGRRMRELPDGSVVPWTRP